MVETHEVAVVFARLPPIVEVDAILGDGPVTRAMHDFL